MTDLQLKYWGLKEEARHNLVWEQETTRHNKETEYVALGTLSESQRHNLATEDLGYKTLDETSRHNRAQESIGYIQAYASQTMAAASMSQANSAYMRAVADVAYTEARTEGQKIKNKTDELSMWGNVANSYTKPLLDVTNIANNVFGFVRDVTNFPYTSNSKNNSQGGNSK